MFFGKRKGTEHKNITNNNCEENITVVIFKLNKLPMIENTLLMIEKSI